MPTDPLKTTTPASAGAAPEAPAAVPEPAAVAGEASAANGAQEPTVPIGSATPVRPADPAEPVAPAAAADPDELVSAAPVGPADPELAALIDRAAKADEYLALAQRTQADFENYRKRAQRDAAAAKDRGVAKLAKELLPAVDNLDRALSAAKEAAAAAGEGDEVHAQLLSGVSLVRADVISAFARAGIESFSPGGELFDPQLHEAVVQIPVEGTATGTVVEVYQRGYKLGDAILRPARVVVAA